MIRLGEGSGGYSRGLGWLVTRQGFLRGVRNDVRRVKVTSIMFLKMVFGWWSGEGGKGGKWTFGINGL